MAEHRAAGYVNREDGDGWVLEDTEPSVEEPVAPPEPEPEPEEEPKPEEVVEEEPSEEEAPSDAEIRAWAKEEGIDVPARGKLAKDIVDLYLNREQ